MFCGYLNDGRRQMKRLFKIIILCAAVISACAVSAYAGTQTLVIDSLNRKYYTDGTEYKFTGKVFEKDGAVYVPADEVLQSMGYAMGWDAERGALCFSDSENTNYIVLDSTEAYVNGEYKQYDKPAINYKNMSYITTDMIYDIQKGINIEIRGVVRQFPMWYRDTLEYTFIPDSIRYEKESVEEYNGYYFLNGVQAFEKINIEQGNALNYAYAVNAVADSVAPLGVKTCDILVPSWSELYAPEEFATNQLEAYKTAYASMNYNVVPINVIDNMIDHHEEKLYFQTDHHWTHRGAYYAYEAFMDCLGAGVVDINSFGTDNVYDFVGSFAGLMDGSAAAEKMRQGELLERFIPYVTNSSAAYVDMNMQGQSFDVSAVDTGIDSYLTFLSGDWPLIRINTNVGGGRVAVVMKESYGNAFATWLMNYYETIYVVDIRSFNGFGGNTEGFDMAEFCEKNSVDDLIIINYPVTVASSELTAAIASFA